MYNYEDYFDESSKYTPYQSGTEELNDWFRFMDLLLEGYLEFKKTGSVEFIFARGLVTTESEMEN